MCNLRSFLLFLVPALGMALHSLPLHAQTYRDQCDTCWRNYTFDPDNFDFPIGSHGWYIPQFYRDSLRFDFGQQYSAANTLFRDTADFQYLFGYQQYRYFTDTIVAQANAGGFKLIFSPGDIRWLIEAAKGPEFHLDADLDVLHTLGFLERWGEQDTALKPRYAFWGRRMPAFDPPHDTLMARTLRGGTRAFQEGLRTLDTALQEYYGDTTGTEKEEEIYALLAANTSDVHYLDSLFHWRVVYTMRATDFPLPLFMPDSTVIAYAVLYRRVTPGQDLCKCAFYEPFYVDTITRKDYEDRASTIPGNPNLALEVRADESPTGQDIQYYDIPGDFVDYIRHDTLVQPVLRRDTCIVPKDSATFDTLLVPRPEIAAWGDTLVDFPSVTMKGFDYLRQTRWFGWPDCGGFPCLSSGYCDSLLLVLKNSGVVSQSAFNREGGVVESSDIDVEFYSTGRVPVTFVRARVESHMYTALMDGRLDFLIRRELDTLTSAPNAPLNNAMMRIGEADEPDWSVYRAQAYLSGRIQDRLFEIDSTDTRGVYANVNSNFDGCRMFTGDLDTTRVKLVQVFPVQPYPIRADPMPIRYANPEKMSAAANTRYYRIDSADWISPGGDTIMNRLIAGTSPFDYRYYTERMQRHVFGSVRDYRNSNSARGDGPPFLPKLARAVDVARYKYASRPDAAPHPVWYVVQVHGYFGANEAVYHDGFINRPPSPEEQTAQVWLALNCGVNGLLFSDFEWDAVLFGPMRRNQTVSSTNLDPRAEYDTLSTYEINPGLFDLHSKQRQLPKMYTGFTTRLESIRRAVNHLRDTILPVYTRLSLAGQMSVHDTALGFGAFSLVDTLWTEKADPYDTSGSPYVGSGVYDPRRETYIELSRFVPGIQDTAGQRSRAQYLILTNRRTWPNSDSLYADSTLDMLRAVAKDTSGYTNRDLGFADARRPIVVLKNPTDIIADSVLVEKVGQEGIWSVRNAFGDTITLDWIDPGWGAMYRVTPIPALLSDLGTAYNNAVRSENPSSDTLARDRMVVYQRDSVVYIRSIDSAGAWSAEVMLSDPADTAVVNGKRIASSFFPALATCRNNEGATRAVWERRDTLGRHSVESIVLFENRITRLNLAAVVDSFSSRHQLLPPSYPEGPPNLTPAIVGVHDTAGTGGFVVAWAGPDSGVTVLAIREIPDGTDFLAWQDTASVRRLHANVPLDSVCQYPTLAHVPRFERMNGSTANLAGSDPEKETDPLTEESLYWLNRVHLAYQQGDGDEMVGEQIYYHPVGVIFPDNRSIPPGLLVGWYEPVTRKIAACSFVHPSIAADSARVGVAFEIVESNAGQRNIGLRFRDTAGSNLGAPLKAWETTLYRWGGPLTRVQKMFGLGAVYERPSLTEFPSMDSLSLAFSPEGGLTWYWSNGPTGRTFPQWLYRYGWFGPREIGDGKHPGMMLVPYIGANPFEETGIFHRGTDSSRVAGVNDAGDPVWRYPSRLLNTPGNPIGYFSTITGGSGIVAGATVAASPSGCNVQRRMDFGIVFSHGSVTHPVDDHFPPVDPPIPPSKPGLPPTFFAPPGGGMTLVDTLSTAWQVVRTGLFVTGNEPVAIRRIAAGGDSLSEWLDTYGWDTARSVPANVWATLELVRAADSSVLWRSDTIDARGLDTLDDPLDDVLGVPVNTAADSGTIAFIRLQCFATEKVVYDLHGGFRFYIEDSTAGGFEKVSRPRIEEESRATTGASRLSVLVLPNPARDRAEVRVRVAAGGQVRLSVWSMRGERLAVLPDLAAEDGGEYSVEISLAAVPAGTYLLRAETADSETALRFNVVR